MIMKAKKILVIERNEEVADSRADLLKDKGYDTSIGAIEAVRSGKYAGMKFDVVFYSLDVTPQGRDMILQLREQQPHAKIIVYTTPFGLEYAAQTIALAGADYLEMIKTPEQIATIIESRRSGSGTGVGFAL